jgi:hypothetical protein
MSITRTGVLSLVTFFGQAKKVTRATRSGDRNAFDFDLVLFLDLVFAAHVRGKGTASMVYLVADP